MKTSAKGLALIKKKEQFVARAYICPAGKLTIGYGHVIQSNEPRLKTAVLTEAEASALLGRDVVQYENAVLRAVHVPLTQNQFDACVSLCYNIGAGGFAGSGVARDLNAGAPFEKLNANWLAWCKMDGTRNGKDDDKDGLIDEPGEKQVSAGLLTRRAEEVALFRS